MATIVHAGLHKTGTTTLQDFLAKHRGMLARAGVHYPLDPHGRLSGTHRLACWLATARDLNGPNDLFTPEREIFTKSIGARNDLASDLLSTLATDLPVTLLSSEIFETYNREELLRLHSFVGSIDRFVLYVRNGMGYLQSCWSSKVRWGYTETFAEFLRATLAFEPATPVLGPLQFTQLLIDVFGSDRVSVRSLEASSTHHQGLLGDFLERELGMVAPESLETTSRSNVSPHQVVIEVTRALNLCARSMQPHARSDLFRALHVALAGPGGASIQEEWTQRLMPLMRPITLGSFASHHISADGSISDLSAPLAALFRDWRFELGEQRLWCETRDLLAAVDESDAFRRLVPEGTMRLL